jgi:hypothetical protein
MWSAICTRCDARRPALCHSSSDSGFVSFRSVPNPPHHARIAAEVIARARMKHGPWTGQLLSCPAGWPVSAGQPSKVVVADRGDTRSCRNCVRFLSAGLLGLGLSSALTWGTAPSKFAPEMRLGPLPSASARYVVRRKNPALLPIRLSLPSACQRLALSASVE